MSVSLQLVSISHSFRCWPELGRHGLIDLRRLKSLTLTDEESADKIRYTIMENLIVPYGSYSMRNNLTSFSSKQPNRTSAKTTFWGIDRRLLAVPILRTPFLISL